MLDLIADFLLVLGSCGLAGYCFVLSSRLKRLSKSDGGLSESVAGISQKIEDLTSLANRTNAEAQAVATRLEALISEAERYEGELAFLLAGSEGNSVTEDQDPPQEATLIAAVEPVFASRAGGRDV